jgi:signal transduction histidine kinase/CheY-like chemotaxis protein
MNREALRAAGVLERGIEGLSDADLRPPEIASAIRAHDRKVLESGEAATYEGPSPFGGAWSLSITFPIRGDKGEIAWLGGFDIDISDRRSLEDQLKRSARIEAVGKLTGGVAHDFNNLLTIVIGNLELAADAARDNRLAAGAIASAMAAAERGADLVARLLAFARQQPLAPAVFDLNEQIRGMRPILERSLGETIELQMTLATDLWPVHADRTQVETAVLNLVINAHDAMPDGGRVLVETRNERLDEGYAALNEDVTPGDYAMLAVSDNGVGMSADTLARAVEPFFTTKEVGRGSGLGLSMVYGFAKQSGGHLKIYSEPDLGTTVRLYLPRAASAADAQIASGAAEARLPGGRESILVVEDNDDVRRIVVKQLASLGYAVSEAPDGPAALERLREDAGIDLLFTDIVMPKGMSGRVLAEQAQAMRPALKVLFTTGYTADAIVHGGRLDEGVALLSKPFSKATLARKIREILDA